MKTEDVFSNGGEVLTGSFANGAFGLADKCFLENVCRPNQTHHSRRSTSPPLEKTNDISWWADTTTRPAIEVTMTLPYLFLEFVKIAPNAINWKQVRELMEEK